MPGVDADRAIERLERFLEASESRRQSAADGWIGPPSYVLVRDNAEATGEAQVAEQILDRVLTDWRTADWPKSKRPFWRQREAATRAIAHLKARQEIAEILGDDAPDLSASSLHPWVWDAARTLWGSGHYREAVSAAARAVSAYTQTKLGRRDRSEWKLLVTAFSTDAPGPSDSRLRLMADDGSDTYRSLHEGAAFLARGLYQGIRNPANHEAFELDELAEHEALEQLAAFSVLARWVDAARIERA